MSYENNIINDLNHSLFGSTIKYISSTNSTNDDAWNIINQNKYSNGMVIYTNHQIKGRGRNNRKWLASINKHLAFSIILSRDKYNNNFEILPLLTAISIVEAIKKYINIDVKLKWPNDIMFSGKKIGGILIEVKKIINKHLAVIGIGINVNETENDLSNEYLINATSLKLISGMHLSRKKLLPIILETLDMNYTIKKKLVLDKWIQSCYHINKDIRFHYLRNIINGKFVGINEQGHAHLIINNKSHYYPSGEILI